MEMGNWVVEGATMLDTLPWGCKEAVRRGVVCRRLGVARRGAAWRGVARRGAAWRGMEWQGVARRMELHRVELCVVCVGRCV